VPFPFVRSNPKVLELEVELVLSTVEWFCASCCVGEIGEEPDSDRKRGREVGEVREDGFEIDVGDVV